MKALATGSDPFGAPSTKERSRHVPQGRRLAGTAGRLRFFGIGV
jgi:hypothetical protein